MNINIGLLDAIKMIDTNTELGEVRKLEQKYKCYESDLVKAACERAVKIMKTAVPMKADKCREEDGRIHWYCPDCTADISNYQDEWSFCPFCGQAVTLPKEE